MSKQSFITHHHCHVDFTPNLLCFLHFKHNIFILYVWLEHSWVCMLLPLFRISSSCTWDGSLVVSISNTIQIYLCSSFSCYFHLDRIYTLILNICNIVFSMSITLDLLQTLFSFLYTLCISSS